jgi:uncharacterized protein
MDRLTFDFEIKKLADEGSFEGYASTFGNRDLGGDIVEKGAFTKSLKERGIRGIKMLLDHDPRQRIGAWKEITEDSDGLYVKGSLFMEKQIGRETHIDLKGGALDKMSIGFRTREDAYDGRRRARLLKDVDLLEVSLVTFPMNELAAVTGVKSFDPMFWRALEADLKTDIGLSSAKAVSAIAIMKKHLREGGDVELPDLSREVDGKALEQSLRNCLTILGV